MRIWTTVGGASLLALAACGSDEDLTVFDAGLTDVPLTTGGEDVAVPAGERVSLLGPRLHR